MTESKCAYCGSLFKNNEELSTHVKIHNDSEPI